MSILDTIIFSQVPCLFSGLKVEVTVPNGSSLLKLGSSTFFWWHVLYIPGGWRRLYHHSKYQSLHKTDTMYCVLVLIQSGLSKVGFDQVASLVHGVSNFKHVVGIWLTMTCCRSVADLLVPYERLWSIPICLGDPRFGSACDLLLGEEVSRILFSTLRDLGRCQNIWRVIQMARSHHLVMVKLPICCSRGSIYNQIHPDISWFFTWRDAAVCCTML